MLMGSVCFLESLSRREARCVGAVEVGWGGWVGSHLFCPMVFRKVTAGGNVEPQFTAAAGADWLQIQRDGALTSRIIPVASS